MPTYDTVGARTQLGPDLNYYSSHGSAWTRASPSLTDPRRKWDSTSDADSSSDRTGGAENNVDICFHQGELYVVWVEPEWNGSVRLARGPFVNRWDGAAWVNVGGEVDPDITPSDIRDAWNPTTEGYPFGSTTARHPTDTTYYPARPRIVSDGTDLYVGYTVRRVTTGAGPPIGSYFTDNSFVRHKVVAGEWTQWISRWARVRRWDGASWELYGEIPAQTCNAIHSKSTFVGDYTGYLDLAASPAEPGVVYLTVWERGQTNVAIRWDLPVNFVLSLVIGTKHYTGLKSRMYSARFDGSSTTGPVREFEAVTTAVVDATGSGSSASAVALGTFIANRNSLATPSETRTDGATVIGYVFWSDPDVPELRMELQSDGSLVQSVTLPGGPVVPESMYANGPVALGRGLGFYYISMFDEIYQVPDDGLGPFDDLDSLPAYAAEGAFLTPTLIADGADNIWTTQGWFADATASEGSLMHYHRPCRAWVDYGKVAGTDSLYGRPALAIDGDTLYYAAAVFSSTDSTQDVKVQVWTVPILRDALSCEGAGIVASIHATFSARV